MERGIAMCNDQSHRQPEWVAIYLRQGWIETGDDSPKEWGSVPQSIRMIMLGDPVDEQVVPVVWLYEDVEPTSEDDPLGELDDEVPST
jgi:hypothetical protein